MYQELFQAPDNSFHLILFLDAQEMTKRVAKELTAHNHVNLHDLDAEHFYRKSFIISMSDYPQVKLLASRQADLLMSKFENWKVFCLAVSKRKAEAIRDRGETTTIRLEELNLTVHLMSGKPEAMAAYIKNTFPNVAYESAVPPPLVKPVFEVIDD